MEMEGILELQEALFAGNIPSDDRYRRERELQVARSCALHPEETTDSEGDKS